MEIEWCFRSGAPKEETEEVLRKVREVYDDGRGWRQWGYTFKERKEGKGVLCINYKNGGNFSGSMKGFSYYDPSKMEIHINDLNWNGDTSAVKEGYYSSLEGYRTYVINHETGHHLEHLHGSSGVHFDPAWKGEGVCPVMVQQTRCPGFCLSMISNPYPTKEDRDLVQGKGGFRTFVDNDKEIRGGGTVAGKEDKNNGSLLPLLLICIIVSLVISLGYMIYQLVTGKYISSSTYPDSSG